MCVCLHCLCSSQQPARVRVTASFHHSQLPILLLALVHRIQQVESLVHRVEPIVMLELEALVHRVPIVPLVFRCRRPQRVLV